MRRFRFIHVVLLVASFAMLSICYVAHTAGIERRIFFTMHPEQDLAAKAESLRKRADERINSSKTASALQPAMIDLRDAALVAESMSADKIGSEMDYAMYQIETKFSADGIFWAMDHSLAERFIALGDKKGADESYRMAADFAYRWNKRNTHREGRDRVNFEVPEYRLVKLMENYSKLEEPLVDNVTAQRLKDLAKACADSEGTYRAAVASIWQHGNAHPDEKLEGVLKVFCEKQHSCKKALSALSPEATGDGIRHWIEFVMDCHYKRIAADLIFGDYYDDAAKILADAGLNKEEQAKVFDECAAHCKAVFNNEKAARVQQAADKLRASAT